MPRAAKANSKKAAKSTPSVPITDSSNQLFQFDSTGSSSIRHALLADSQPAAARLRKGQSFKKPLKSDLILAARSSVPAVSGRVVPPPQVALRKDKERRELIDRKTRDRLNRMTGRDGKGKGLWAIKSRGNGDDEEEMVSEAVKRAGEYDAWEVQVPTIGKDGDEAMAEVIKSNSVKKALPKPPKSLRSHALLSSSSTPLAIPVPHPGMSYNPSHPHHQALLSHALEKYTAIEEREERPQAIKDAMDERARATRGKEPWELFEEEVGQGEVDLEEDVEDGEGVEGETKKAKVAKRKTRQQRTKKLILHAENQALLTRRAKKALHHAVTSAPSLISTHESTLSSSLASKALASKAKKALLASQGLTRLRSGPSKVPDANITFQLGEELADNLRTLKPEGNLWRDWVGSGMRRGKVPVERANANKKGGKRGGRGKDKGSKIKIKERHSYKNWTG